ncbi:MAG: RluA family pseudouridine synthase [Lactobacillaceae bacterium]|jgi:23S rRNA pseudouridine1911/1915/1917 synthase|nr:RluA family pseudouridine synthase [Lactobacillaceae bacterium]
MINPWQYQINIEHISAGLTLKDQLIQWRFPRWIRGLLRQQKRLFINGQLASTATILKAGDIISFDLFAEDFSGLQSYPANFEATISVVFEDEDYLIIDKPSGMKMHPHSPNEDDTLLNYAQAYLEKSNSRNAEARAMMTHRLDRNTSGLVVAAKNPLAVAILDQMFADKTIKRFYTAEVSHDIEQNEGTINSPIAVDPQNPYKRIVSIDGQSAITHFEKIAQRTLKLQLETGRTHQIRVHLASLGLPIVGDDLYGGTPAKRMLLDSTEIEIPELFSSRTNFYQKTSNLFDSK